MRRGRDSNPRRVLTLAGFQDQCNQPDSATPPRKLFNQKGDYFGYIEHLNLTKNCDV